MLAARRRTRRFAAAGGQFAGGEGGDRGFPVGAGHQGDTIADARAGGDEPAGEVLAVQPAAAVDQQAGAGFEGMDAAGAGAQRGGKPGEADLEALDLARPALALGLGDAVVQVGADLLEPAALGGVRPQERAPDTGLTEMILVTCPGRCGLRGVLVLTDGDWQKSWLAAVIGVSLGMTASFQSWPVR